MTPEQIRKDIRNLLSYDGRERTQDDIANYLGISRQCAVQNANQLVKDKEISRTKGAYNYNGRESTSIYSAPLRPVKKPKMATDIRKATLPKPKPHEIPPKIDLMRDRDQDVLRQKWEKLAEKEDDLVEGKTPWASVANIGGAAGERGKRAAKFREEIRRRLKAGKRVTDIANELGRPSGTVSHIAARLLIEGADVGSYQRAENRGARPNG